MPTTAPHSPAAPPNSGFVIIAHRGDQSAAPENTFPAFDAALAGGFSHCETDVQLTRDSVAVILHDEQLGRTNDGAGPVAEASWAALQQLDAGGWFAAAAVSTHHGIARGDVSASAPEPRVVAASDSSSHEPPSGASPADGHPEHGGAATTVEPCGSLHQRGAVSSSDSPSSQGRRSSAAPGPTASHQQAAATCRIPSLRQLLERYSGRMHLHLELKSRQPDLPHTVAGVVSASGWLPAAAAGAAVRHADEDASPVTADGSGGTPAALQQVPLLPGCANSLQALSPSTAAQPDWGPPAACSAAGRQDGTQPPAPDGTGPHTHFPAVGLTITSFHLPQLQASVRLLPHVLHGWLVQEIDEAVLHQARAAGVMQICPRANACTADGISAALAAGFSVRCWGVKTPELMLQVARWGAQGATVNWPAAAAAALQATQSSSDGPGSPGRSGGGSATDTTVV